jgi:hypothetical protein
MISDRLFCVGSASHCRGGTIVDGDARPLFAWSACAQPVTVVLDTTREGSLLDLVRSVGVGSACHCYGGEDR